MTRPFISCCSIDDRRLPGCAGGGARSDLSDDRRSFPAGAIVTSPFGVDRTAGLRRWHQGLDIANSAGMGDPIKSGSNGTASYRYQRIGAGHYMTVTSGDTRYIYMHMRRALMELSGKRSKPASRLASLAVPVCPSALLICIWA